MSEMTEAKPDQKKRVATMEEAIEWTTRFLNVIGVGEVELRPIFDESDFAPAP